MPAREIQICGDVAFVPLTQGLVAIIDASDAPLAAFHNWCATINKSVTYAVRSASKDEPNHRARILLHRVIMSAPDDLLVDHINGDGLDCRRANMRLATFAENARNQRRRITNTSGFKGVSYVKESGKWQARIRFAGARENLGYFATREEASAAYVEASKRLHGEFSRTV